MGIIAWIVLGLGAGLLANMLIPGRRSQGLIITCVIGIAGALLGGWLATKLFHVVTLHGFFNLSTWLTAIAGAAILLLAYHLVTSRSTGRSAAAAAAAGHAGGRTGEHPGAAPPAADAITTCLTAASDTTRLTLRAHDLAPTGWRVMSIAARMSRSSVRA